MKNQKLHMSNVQQLLQDKKIPFSYSFEDGCASIDFQYRGLSYHIWEFADESLPCGVETNIFHAGRTIEIEGDYESVLIKELNTWT